MPARTINFTLEQTWWHNL